MSLNRYPKFINSLTSPATRSMPIVPHDTDELAVLPKAIWIGTAGTVVGRLIDDAEERTFVNLTVGYHPLRFKLIKAAGTTAADMLALD